MFKPQISAATNLELQGSIGAFSVGHGSNGKSSIEVKYFLTHVSLDFKNSSASDALPHLVPVREIFETESLEFDEIMQRDIDDARVSSELIPYLLDEHSNSMVKLFPPIVVVVLPVPANENRPDDRYPEVKRYDKDVPGENYKMHVVQSGGDGNEVFVFEQPKAEDRLFDHDNARLRLNTNRCKLVIVDGQHRAMALLAIFRNMKQGWSSTSCEPFKEYYEEWTADYIKSFKISNISLPVMFCTFPELDTTYAGGYDLKKAARSVFLTLNRTARKVSDSRNKLLDDSDLIASFMRDTLSLIKKKDALSQYSLRISNIELDQVQDKTKVSSKIAISAVSHFYHIIEFITLNKQKDVNGVSVINGKFYKRNDIQSYGLVERLDAINSLGLSVVNSSSRNVFDTEAEGQFVALFREAYGKRIIEAFERIGIFEKHNQATRNLETKITTDGNARLRPMIFESQNMGRVFQDHRANLESKMKDSQKLHDLPVFQELKKKLDGTNKKMQEYIEYFEEVRAAYFLSSVSDKGKLKKDEKFDRLVVSFLNRAYSNVFTSIAFQTAILATFFFEEDRIWQSIEKKIDADEFRGYLQKISDYFQPQSASEFRKIVSLFEGDLRITDGKIEIIANNRTFKSITCTTEMQPDQWPKYRYLMLEIWTSNDQDLSGGIANGLAIARSQIYKALHERHRQNFLIEYALTEEDLTTESAKNITKQTREAYFSFLKLFPKNAEIKNDNAFWESLEQRQTREDSPASEEED